MGTCGLLHGEGRIGQKRVHDKRCDEPTEAEMQYMIMIHEVRSFEQEICSKTAKELTFRSDNTM
jgi:hypothetical protein